MTVFRILSFGILFLNFCEPGTSANAAPTPFNYSSRIRSYSGWSSGIQGDANTIGMAGATVAIPTSIAAAEANPAGFAMVTAALSAQINKSKIYDSHVQKNGESYEVVQWGLAVTPPPWAFGITYYTPAVESGAYVSPNTGKVLPTEVSVKQWRFNVARAFFENKLSLGLAFEWVKGYRTLGDASYDNTSAAIRVGGLYHVADHVIFGLSIEPQTTIDPSSTGPTQVDMPGFNSPIVIPTVAAAGIGWIPNRFFKLGLDLHFISGTTNTALLADQSKAYGQDAILQPRVGASYVLADYQNFKIEYALGTYYEVARVAGTTNRFHATSAIDINPYFFNTSFGFDLAPSYRNLIVNVGLDIVRTLRTFDIIPKDPVPPYKGYFPPITVSADGLPEGLVKGEATSVEQPDLQDVGKIIRDIPKKIEEKMTTKKEVSLPKARAKPARGRARERESLPSPTPSP